MLRCHVAEGLSLKAIAQIAVAKRLAKTHGADSYYAKRAEGFAYWHARRAARAALAQLPAQES